MNQQGFEDYTYFSYGRKTGASSSYITAIHILDRIFSIKDVFELQGKSLTEVDDEYLLQRIADFVVSEEKKFKSGSDSIFKYGLDTQKSYPRGGFCSAAMRHLQRYQAFEPQEITANAIAESLSGTYDLAFDQHLISFDEDYKMIVGKEIRDHFTNTVAHNYFEKFVGKKITMPSRFLPNQIFLQVHRELLR